MEETLRAVLRSDDVVTCIAVNSACGVIVLLAGLLLKWLAVKSCSGAWAAAKWAVTPRPQPELSEVARMIVAAIGAAKLREDREATLQYGHTLVYDNSVQTEVKGGFRDVPLSRAECRAVRAAYRARLARLAADEEESLRAAAATGNQA